GDAAWGDAAWADAAWAEAAWAVTASTVAAATMVARTIGRGRVRCTTLSRPIEGSFPPRFSWLASPGAQPPGKPQSAPVPSLSGAGSQNRCRLVPYPLAIHPCHGTRQL